LYRRSEERGGRKMGARKEGNGGEKKRARNEA